METKITHAERAQRRTVDADQRKAERELKAKARAEEAAARKAESEQHKAAIKAEQEALRVEASKPPADFQTWGYTRTAAWIAVSDKCRRVAGHKRTTLSKINTCRQAMRDVGTATLQACSEIINGENAK
jgi:ribosomal protein S14